MSQIEKDPSEYYTLAETGFRTVTDEAGNSKLVPVNQEAQQRFSALMREEIAWGHLHCRRAPAP